MRALVWSAAQLRRPSAAELVKPLPLLHDGEETGEEKKARAVAKKKGGGKKAVREWAARSEQADREVTKAWTLVDSRAALEAMCSDVRTIACGGAAGVDGVGPAVAVDLEHHCAHPFYYLRLFIVFIVLVV